MKRFVKYTLLALIVVATLGLSGCANQGQPRQRKEKFQVVSLDKVNGSIGEGWKITLTVANNTASNMRITNAAAYIRHNNRKIGRVVLDGEVLLPRRRCSQAVAHNSIEPYCRIFVAQQGAQRRLFGRSGRLQHQRQGSRFDSHLQAGECVARTTRQAV